MYAAIISFLTCGLVQPQRKARKAHVAPTPVRKVAASPFQRRPLVADVVKGNKAKPARRTARSIFADSAADEVLPTITEVFQDAFCTQAKLPQHGTSQLDSTPFVSSTASSVPSFGALSAQSTFSTPSATSETPSPDVDRNSSVSADVDNFHTTSTMMTSDLRDGVLQQLGYLFTTRDKCSSASLRSAASPGVSHVKSFQTTSTSSTTDTLNAICNSLNSSTMQETSLQAMSCTATDRTMSEAASQSSIMPVYAKSTINIGPSPPISASTTLSSAPSGLSKASLHSNISVPMQSMHTSTISGLSKVSLKSLHYNADSVRSDFTLGSDFF